MKKKIQKQKISEELQQILESIVNEFWEVEQEEDRVTLMYEDSCEILEMTIELNDYGNAKRVTITHLMKDEEIMVPEACHDCSQDCPFYSEEGCKITEDDIQKEWEDWTQVPELSTPTLTIRRIVGEERCFTNFVHTHLYKGYEIEIKEANNLLLRDIYNVLEVLIEVYEEYVKE